jgi:hemolysin III
MPLSTMPADANCPDAIMETGRRWWTKSRGRPRASVTERAQSLGEEIANSVSHGVGLLAALAGMPLLLGLGGHAGGPAIAAPAAAASAPGSVGAGSIAGSGVFAATMVALYLSSTLYHALPAGGAKRLFMKFDHGAIYLFIAGSYTPFALGALGGLRGWMLFALVWSLAAVGVALTAFDRLARPWPSTALYLVMGWLIVIAAGPLIALVPLKSLVLLVAGGVSYTAGVAFFLLDSKLRYGHAIWHAFVVTGTGCHYGAVLACGP